MWQSNNSSNTVTNVDAIDLRRQQKKNNNIYIFWCFYKKPCNYIVITASNKKNLHEITEPKPPKCIFEQRIN